MVAEVVSPVAATLAAPDEANKSIAAIVDAFPGSEERVAKAVTMVALAIDKTIPRVKSGGSEADGSDGPDSGSAKRQERRGFPFTQNLDEYGSPGHPPHPATSHPKTRA